LSFLREKDTPKGLFDSVFDSVWGFKTVIESGQLFYFNKNNGIWRPYGDKLIRARLRDRYKDIPTVIEREVIRFVEDCTFINAKDFGPDYNFITLNKGELDIRDLDYVEAFDASHNNRAKFNIDYDPKAWCPNFLRFMREILPDSQDRFTVLEGFAAVLIPEMNLEKAFMLIGLGANGKSTLFNVFKDLMDIDSYCAVSIHSLIYNRFIAAELDGRIANIYPDINSTVIKELDRFKMIISSEVMTVERKNGQPFPIKPITKHFFSANQPPEIKEDTDAVFRRFVMIEFPNSFLEKTNVNLLEELVKEKSGIFNLLVHIARALKNS